MTDSLSKIDLMKIAIEEQNKCSSYPKVGCVIVKEGKILSQAFRGEVYGKHAERIAIEKLGPSDLKGSTIVTTLEPCVEISSNQCEKSCADIIIEHGVKEVLIGVLDPNGKIYCQGYDKLLQNNVQVSFFTPELREVVEANTFKYGDCNLGYGPSGKRRVAVIGSGKNFEIQYSKGDDRRIKFRWNTLQFKHGVVDLISGVDNNSIRNAIGVRSFEHISDPLVFRETSHYARMKEGDIAIIHPSRELFTLLIKLLELTETDIHFQWQVR